MIKPRSSIGLKITVLVLCGASLVFALALAYSYSYSRRIILDEAESSARNLALSVARRIEQEFRAAAKVPKGLAAVLETSNPDKETLLRLIRRMVEGSREVYGSAVAFEPHAFDKGLRWFAPYYYKSKAGINTNCSDQLPTTISPKIGITFPMSSRPRFGRILTSMKAPEA